MSLLDLIRPQWKHSNPEVRIAAIQAMDSNQQEIFASIIQSDKHPKVRQTAARKLTLSRVLTSLLQDSDTEIRSIAQTKLQDEMARVLRSHEGPMTQEIRQMIRDMRPSSLSDEVLRNARSAEVRKALAQKCNKAGVLLQSALRDPDIEVALIALKGVNRDNLLQDAADHSRHPEVRAKAAERLRAQAEKSEIPTDPSVAKAQEEQSLRPKREAVLAHAQRLLDTRDYLSNEADFKQVVAEAQALGMGPVENEFERLSTNFMDRCQEQRERLEQEARSAQEKEKQQTERLEVLKQFEALVNEGVATDLDQQAQALQTRWRELEGAASPDQAKRFQATWQRYLRQSQQAQEQRTGQEEVERTNALRSDLLEQLKLLVNMDDTAAMERQLRGLVREWESLPLLEGEDAQLQAYNQLREQLGARLREHDAEKQKLHEERLVKLQALISRIQNLDENQEFKEISKTLRATYLEWKEIVGEDKFQFHDIWKEYRAATERFEEMKEWESWRNEQERDHIIKEIEALLQLDDAADALSKMRHLQQQWKETGFVPQPRLQEYWDRYKIATDQVSQKFHEYIEEQNVQRQKNLEKKIALCDEMDRINADESDQWKDKAKRVQQMQEEWRQAGAVPRDQNQSIWERFRASCDIFYSKHKEFLSREDAGRHVNLEKKIALCELAESLQESMDWLGCTKRLRKLQEEWKTVGPVPKANSEEVWTRFRKACDVFFNRKRQHFEELDQEKQENLQKKVAICERLEAMDLDPTVSGVDEIVKAVESEWKSIGMVPKDEVDALWDRYCHITDQYLERRAAQDPAIREELEQRRKSKESLIVRVRELTSEAGSNQASDTVRQFQEDWKHLGRSGLEEQNLYHQFRAVCDEFFERRRDQMEIQEQARKNNLQRKTLLVEQVERLLEGGNINEASLDEVKHLRRLWKEVGAVPREHSDHIWKRFNSACDAVFAAVRGEKRESHSARV
ncbi:MAG TPA: DUF349 domain-containing protein [Fibrobacteraceae bacterium]|nr:DUF349 domain-containing protein [Fibrobacteraceae bacterium]